MPDWLSSKPAAPPTATVQFGSEPPGADVHTVQGQTCQTPCSLAIPVQSQAVSISRLGYEPQTVQLNVNQPEDHSLFSSTPPDLQPNPIEVVLQPAAPPPKPIRKPRPPRRVVAKPTRPPPPPGGAPQSAAPPPASDSAFPPPPQQAPDPAFPPPPGQH